MTALYRKHKSPRYFRYSCLWWRVYFDTFEFKRKCQTYIRKEVECIHFFYIVISFETLFEIKRMVMVKQFVSMHEIIHIHWPNSYCWLNFFFETVFQSSNCYSSYNYWWKFRLKPCVFVLVGYNTHHWWRWDIFNISDRIQVQCFVWHEGCMHHKHLVRRLKADTNRVDGIR